MKDVEKLAEVIKAAHDRVAPIEGLISIRVNDGIVEIHLSTDSFIDASASKKTSTEYRGDDHSVYPYEESFTTASGCRIFRIGESREEAA